MPPGQNYRGLPMLLASWFLLTALAAQQPAASDQPAPAPAQADEPTAPKPDDTAAAKPAEQAPQPDPNAPGFHEEMTVTATRYQVDSYDTPTPISVITAQDLARLNPEKIVDALKREPGIEVAGEGPFRGLPVIRGLSSNRVLILVDGQRLNNSRESTEFAGIQPGLVDLSQVERIEVLRGPASVLYGSDALGGVINIITRQPAFSAQGFNLGGSVGLTYGTATDSRNGQLDLTGASERYTFRHCRLGGGRR